MNTAVQRRRNHVHRLHACTRTVRAVSSDYHDAGADSSDYHDAGADYHSALDGLDGLGVRGYLEYY